MIPIFSTPDSYFCFMNLGQRIFFFMTIQAEQAFLTLPQEERRVIISHGAALRLSDLKKRHFLAISKIRQFEEKYHTTLTQLEQEGLPNDADYEMHEDYIMWQHWTTVYEEVTKSISSLETITQQGLFQRDIG